MKLLVVVPARMGSTRLPGKVLLPLAGAPLLQRVVERVRAVRRPLELVVATTEARADDRIASLCRTLDVACFRGHATDLLDRHYQAACTHGADVVATIAADSALIDPAALERVLDVTLASRCDYVSNLRPASWPDGNAVEVVRFEALRAAWRHACCGERGGAWPWSRARALRCANVEWETGFDLSLTHRLTVDYPEDYALAAAVYDALWQPAGPVFDIAAILRLLARRADVFDTNAHLAAVNRVRERADAAGVFGASLAALQGTGDAHATTGAARGWSRRWPSEGEFSPEPWAARA